MKFLLLLLPLTVFASLDNVQVEIIEQLDQINKINVIADKAKLKLSAQGDKDALQSKIDIYKALKLEAIASKIVELQADKGKEEAKCLIELRNKLAAYQISYGANDTCSQLKVLCEANVDCSGQSQE